MPVLVELLAATKPQAGVPLPDISKDAVERFLQWTPKEERRQVALLAAVPRQFNRDILSAVLGYDATSMFNWLAVASTHKKLENVDQSMRQARALFKSDDRYNLACLESVCGNVDAAIEHLRRAARLEKFDRDWAKRDPDFEWIRDDPRFAEIVGT